MEEWKEYKLGDLITLYSGGTPDKNNKSYWEGNIPWISAKSMYEDYLYSSELKISQEGLVKGSRLAPKGSILLLTRGSGLFNRIPVCYTMRDLAYNQDVKRIESCKKELVSTEFLFYWLMGNKDSISSILETTGIGAGKIDTNRLKNIQISLPPIRYQQALIIFAKSLMHKIEVNRRINENLEQQAQALFKSWFVDFEPFKDQPFVESELGMIPQGWKIYKLSDFLPVLTGKKDANEANGGGYPFFSCSQTQSWIDNYSFDGSAILVAGNGDFNVKMYTGKFEAYQRTYVLIPYEPLFTAWLYYAVKYHLNSITSAARGSVIKFITKGNLSDFIFPAPIRIEDCNVINQFDTIRKTIALKDQESRRLAELRDALLPKLMSGEIKVEDVTL